MLFPRAQLGKGCGRLAPRGSRGKKGRTPPGRPGTEGHLQRLQMRARLGGLNPARGAKLTPAPRPGLLCRCQKVNPPGTPGTLRLADGEGGGGGRRPTASHSPWPFTLWRAAGAPRQLHRAPRSRPPHSSCAPAASRPVQRRPPRAPPPSPRPSLPTPNRPPPHLHPAAPRLPGFAEEGGRPRPRRAGPALVPPRRGRVSGRGGIRRALGYGSASPEGT